MKSIEEKKADYNLFTDIQMGKYLKSVNKSEFSSDAEAKLVLDHVLKAYNQFVAADTLRLDNLNSKAKAKWFNSIDIDFQHNVSDVMSDYDDNFDEEYENVSEFFAERFPFLPERAVSVLLFVGPAIEAYGLPFERFQELMLGDDECTEIEEDILLWAFDLTMGVMGSVFERSKAKKEKYYNQALAVAKEELSEREAEKVVKAIASAIRDFEKLPDIQKSDEKKKR